MHSDAATVEEYLAGVPEDRRSALTPLDVIGDTIASIPGDEMVAFVRSAASPRRTARG